MLKGVLTNMSDTKVNLYQQFNRLIPVIADLQQLAEPEESNFDSKNVITRMTGYADAQELGRGIQNLIKFLDHSLGWLSDYNAHINEDRLLISKYGAELHRLRKFANLQMSMLLCELAVLNNRDQQSMLFFTGEQMQAFTVPDQQIIYAANKSLFSAVKRLYNVGGRFKNWNDFMVTEFYTAEKSGSVRGAGYDWKTTIEILHILDLILTTTVNKTDLMKYYKSQQFSASVHYLNQLNDEFASIRAFINSDFNTALATYGNELTYLYSQIIDLVDLLRKFLQSVNSDAQDTVKN